MYIRPPNSQLKKTDGRVRPLPLSFPSFYSVNNKPAAEWGRWSFVTSRQAGVWLEPRNRQLPH